MSNWHSTSMILRLHANWCDIKRYSVPMKILEMNFQEMHIFPFEADNEIASPRISYRHRRWLDVGRLLVLYVWQACYVLRSIVCWAFCSSQLCRPFVIPWLSFNPANSTHAIQIRGKHDRNASRRQQCLLNSPCFLNNSLEKYAEKSWASTPLLSFRINHCMCQAVDTLAHMHRS